MPMKRIRELIALAVAAMLPAAMAVALRTIMLLAALIVPCTATAWQSGETSDGVAVARVADREYTIPVLCDDAARPEMGFSTEPSRVTRERTGRASSVNLRLRTWEDTDLVVVSFDRYVTWMPRPSSIAGALTVETDMQPMTVTREGMPVAYTYDMWNSGDRPAELAGLTFEVRCGLPQPVAPSVRNVGAPDRTR
jgi:hypothetical protein